MERGNQGAMIWFGLAAAAGCLASATLGGGLPILPLFLCGVGLICAAHRPSRRFVVEKVAAALSGSVLRSVLIVIGAALIFQVLGLELALLMAADVLAYVELLAAVGLVAANTRLKPLKAVVGRRIALIRQAVRTGRRSVARAVRLPARRKPPAGDDAGPAGAADWAFA